MHDTNPPAVTPPDGHAGFFAEWQNLTQMSAPQARFHLKCTCMGRSSLSSPRRRLPVWRYGEAPARTWRLGISAYAGNSSLCIRRLCWWPTRVQGVVPFS